MFHRIIYDHWTDVVPILGFFLTFAVFLAALIKALMMKKEHREHMAALPLEENQTSPCKCDNSCGCCTRKQNLSSGLNPNT